MRVAFVLGQLGEVSLEWSTEYVALKMWVWGRDDELRLVDCLSLGADVRKLWKGW